MNNKKKYYKDALIYNVLDKERFFSLITSLLNDKKYETKFFKNEVSLQSYFDDKIDNECLIKRSKKIDSFYFLLIDTLLWIFIEDIDKTEELVTEIEEYFHEIMKKVRVADKKFIELVFTSEFSDNLLEITVEEEGISDFLNTDTIYGSQLNYSYEYEQIINNDDLEIFSYKLQPIGGSNIVTFRDENIIEFSKHMKLAEMAANVKVISSHYQDYIKG